MVLEAPSVLSYSLGAIVLAGGVIAPLLYAMWRRRWPLNSHLHANAHLHDAQDHFS